MSERDSSKREMEIMHSIISYHERVEGKVCAYCASLATDLEHIVPISFTDTSRANYARHYLVNACRHCNAMKGDKVFTNFWEIKQYLARRLRTKNKKLLEMPDWSPDEIDGLQGRLKRHVFLSMKKKQGVLDRLRALETPEVFGEKTALN